MTAAEILHAIQSAIQGGLAATRDNQDPFARGMAAAYEIMQDTTARYQKIVNK